ncbi:MAG: hypothetical protein KH369_15070 [Paraclostridium bifermentans]|uniref:hypothetical protein n=1 Tax=Paraclostridium bifermentans TaxID=1490 RepID=UPI001D88CE26|nr:hypothetical protein [Paraclostridium bifermentans]MBS6509519.1 hypothetical protein [Paraclostridium bifermentans]
MNKKKVGKFAFISIVVIISIPILIIGLLFLLYFGISTYNGSISKTSMEPFNSVLNAPDSYNILDATKWKSNKTIKSPIFTACEDITVITRDKDKVNQITDILNKIDYTPITRSLFSEISDNPSKNLHLWLACAADTDEAKLNYFPYEVLITKDNMVYILTSKKNEDRFLKGSLNYDDLKAIKDIYEPLYNDEHRQY